MGASKSKSKELAPDIKRRITTQLSKFDTCVILDDSGSMFLEGSKKGKSRWTEALELLETIVPIAAEADDDGIEVLFFNDQRKLQMDKESASEKMEELKGMRPDGSTPLANRLNVFLCDVDPATKPLKKPWNVIVVTDGSPNDSWNVVQTLKRHLRRLGEHKAPGNKPPVSLQFFQVGKDAGASAFLRSLDDDLCKKAGLQDVIDVTIPEKKESLTYTVLKTLVGAVDRDMDADDLNKQLAKVM